jgi:ParB-like chromosome segregation protein Spo0J
MESNIVDFKVLETKIVDIAELQPNEYNPNRMPDSEMSLLRQSIEKYGFVFPIIATWDEKLQKYRIIDGYHRYETLLRMNCDKAAIIDMRLDYHEAVQLTVLMNRIKGLHQVERMSELVLKLEELGLTDYEISENLGMENEELLRLKQQLGIAHAFRNHEYSKSWEIDK